MSTKLFYNAYEIQVLREVRREGAHRQGLASIPINNSFVQTEIQPFNNVSQYEIENAFNQVKEDIKRILIPLN